MTLCMWAGFQSSPSKWGGQLGLVALNEEQGSCPCPWRLLSAPFDYGHSRRRGRSVGCRGELRRQGDADLGLKEEGCSPDKALHSGTSLAGGKSGGGAGQGSGRLALGPGIIRAMGWSSRRWLSGRRATERGYRQRALLLDRNRW
jgi:hypothetical protein